MNPIQDEIALWEKPLVEIAGPEYEGINKYLGGQLPYRWEFRTRIEPIRYVATVELEPSDILKMTDMADDKRREYLRERFGHLFERQ